MHWSIQLLIFRREFHLLSNESISSYFQSILRGTLFERSNRYHPIDFIRRWFHHSNSSSTLLNGVRSPSIDPFNRSICALSSDNDFIQQWFHLTRISSNQCFHLVDASDRLRLLVSYWSHPSIVPVNWWFHLTMISSNWWFHPIRLIPSDRFQPILLVPSNPIKSPIWSIPFIDLIQLIHPIDSNCIQSISS